MKNLYLVLGVVCIQLFALPARAQIISTISGTGAMGFSGDGGPATAAALYYPYSVTGDGAGNIYIADASNNRIREINTSGVITTIAGSSSSGFGGDGGPATAASLNGPVGICFDPAGNMYIADQVNQRVRKINTTGIISTFAGSGTSGFSGDGGAATAARLYLPTAVIADASGNVYIADQFNYRVRVVNSSGIITTFAGTSGGFSGDGGPATAAQMNLPCGMAFDGSGNMYITDYSNHRIRKVNPSGIITTIAGSTAGFSGDGGPASAAQLNNPWGIATDVSNNIYITDFSDHRIRKINTAGIINTITGLGFAGFSGDGGISTLAAVNNPSGVYVNSAGVVYLCDTHNNRIRIISGNNTPPSFTGGVSQALTVCENAAATPINSLLAVADPDIGQTETWSLLSAPLHGTAVVTYSTLSTGGTLTPTGLTYTPTTGYSGADAFKVKVSDGLAADTITIYVTINSLPNAGSITGPSSVCAGATITLTDTAGGGIGVWTSSNTHATVSGGIVTGISAGTATITYTLINACGSAFAVKTITVNQSPAAISGPASFCIGATIALTDASPGGAWSSSNTFAATIGSASGLVTGHAAGIAIITYSLNGCFVTKTITVNGLPNAGTIQNDGANAFCIGDTRHVWDTTAGGIWALSNSHVVLSGSTLTAVSSGPDTVLYIVSNSCGSDTAFLPFWVAPPLPPITGKLSVCVGDTTMLRDSVWGGMWSGGSGIAYLGSNLWDSGIVAGLSAGIATITYHMDLGCTTTIQVTVNPAPNAGTITGPNPVCIGASFKLTDPVPGGTWSSSSPAIATIGSLSGMVNSLALGTTIITYTVGPNGFGCMGYTRFPLTVKSSTLIINGIVSAVKCYGEQNGTISVTVSGGSPPFQYLWSTNATTDSIAGLAPGSYLVTVTETTTNCTTTNTFNITEPDSMQVTADVKKDRCHSGIGSISVAVTGGTSPYSYLWSNNATGNEATGLDSGSYSLSVTDKNGCIKKLSIDVTDTCSGIVIHDVITPNGDGINDTWVIEGIQNYPANKVQVFDKWGDLVYEHANYNNDWGGNGRNGLLPDGTYYYLVKLNQPNSINGRENFTGTILIKR